MAAKPKASGGPRLPAGKKQMLSILDENLIRQIKVAAAEDGIKLSEIVEQATREWLAKRKNRRPTK